MAYGKKYFHQYCNSEGADCEVAVYQIDYEGAAVELQAAPIPFRKSYSTASEFKFEPLRPSTGTAVFVFNDEDEVDFEQFWTADEKKYQIQHFVGGVLKWIGFIIPNGFSYEFKGGYYEGVLTAADGLSTLSKIPFAFNSNVPYGTQDLVYNDGFVFPFSLMATEILRKLDLDLDLWIAVDVYERTMDPTLDTRFGDPLSASGANVKTYINNTPRTDIPYWKDANEVMDCKQVLENLCYIFGAKVYQNEGVWRIKRVNVDADFGSGATTRYWRKFNTACVYLGREAAGQDVLIPCATVSKAMIGTDHLMTMDSVYSAFRVNYDYTFVRDGDNPVNLITNGSFAGWVPSSKFDAPTDWFRWRYKNDVNYIKVSPVTLTPDQAGGNLSAIEMGTQPPGFDGGNIDRTAKRWASLRYTKDINLTKGDKLSLSLWQKTQQQFSDPRAHAVSMLYRVRLQSAFGKVYFLRNDPTNAEHGLRYLSWVEIDEGKKDGNFINSTDQDVFFWLRGGIGQAVENDAIEPINTNGWRRFEMILQDVPEAGNATFDVIGLASQSMPTSKFNPPLTVYQIGFNGLEPYPYGPVRTEFFDSTAAKYPQVTGIQFGKIPNEAELPESQDYVYENQSGAYTLEVDPITVLNGDTQDVDHISNIIVPSNVSDGKNFWDTISGDYGLSSLGLITCKSIMNLYIKPFRILEGTIKASGVNFDTRFEFEALPGKFFSLMSATFNEKKNYVEDAVFFEISSIPLAAGGREGENTLDPVWIQTGNFLCAKTDGVNNGILGYEERDVNPNSDTYQQIRFPASEYNIDICPLGEPTKFYFGTDGVVLSLVALDEYPFFSRVDGGQLVVQCQITNPGGEYIYFVHLASLGLVESVFTNTQDEIVSDFQYLADVMNEGYTYKVLRQDYVTADFVGLDINFKFS